MNANYNPIVSVIIPVYNREDTIRRTIQSIFDQTYKNFEIIVVNDGSTDGTADEALRFKSIKLKLFSQINLGANTARNKGIELAAGKYIAFLDSDDYFFPHHLEDSIKAIRNLNDTAVFSQVLVNRGNNLYFYKPHRGPKENEDISDYLMRRRGFIQTSTIVIQSDIAKKVKFLDGLPAGQDTDFAIKLSAYGIKFKMLDRPGVVWSDEYRKDRISLSSDPDVRLQWLLSIRPLITNKAFYGYRGWHIAKIQSEKGFLQYGRAFYYYFVAVFKGCYHPKLSIVIFLQILLRKKIYHKISDAYLILRMKEKN